tara:strand:- start:660 stop:1235 length:576 start_codon:yes stop_codon:yes gene_type:complete
MIRIALVGEIGSGKSYASRLFGFPVFNADKEVIKIYKKDRKAYQLIKKKLPNHFFSFPIRKEQIAHAVNKNTKNLKTISKVIHPLVRKKMRTFLRKNRKKKAIVLDIPLYFENNLNKKGDVIIFISTRKKNINSALLKRRKSNIKLLKKLGKLQQSIFIKKKKSHYVIKNDFNSKNLKKNVKIIKYKILNK